MQVDIQTAPTTTPVAPPVPTAPTAAPPPFRILVDTREQTPLPFSPSVPTRRATLYPGDYSIDGMTHLFAVERKSLADLIGSLIGFKPLADGTRRYNRDRLVEELLAMRAHRFRCVAVTAPRYAVEGHQYQSRIAPENVIGMIASIEAFTGVQFKFFASPEEAARWVAVEALHFWRHERGLSTLRPKVRAGRLREGVVCRDDLKEDALADYVSAREEIRARLRAEAGAKVSAATPTGADSGAARRPQADGGRA